MSIGCRCDPRHGRLLSWSEMKRVNEKIPTTIPTIRAGRSIGLTPRSASISCSSKALSSPSIPKFKADIGRPNKKSCTHVRVRYRTFLYSPSSFLFCFRFAFSFSLFVWLVDDHFWFSYRLLTAITITFVSIVFQSLIIAGIISEQVFARVF